MNTRIIPEFGNEPAEVLEIKPFKHIEKLIDNVLPYERGDRPLLR